MEITLEEHNYFNQLDERQQRLYVGLKAKLLGYHGVRLVSIAYNVNVKTVRKGKSELSNLSPIAVKRIRKVGGGPKKIEAYPELLESFDAILEMTIAGLPQDKDIKWTHLSERTIGDNLADKNQIISRYHVRQMLKFRQYKKRALLKKIALKDVEGRNEQFEKIRAYRTSFTNEGLPVISIDTKKKELLGNFSRSGTAYCTSVRHANDHDFQTSADGQIVPHGIYDVNENIGYLTLGLSKDTSEFVCDNLSKCWTEILQYKYPNAETMLLLCDGGGSNASAHYIVKQDLAKLAKSLNINILVAHYPPYCSKWNGSGQPSD